MRKDSINTSDFSKLSSPIIIVAYMHSGTTLLQQIIGRNPAVFIGGGETRHFLNLAVTKNRYAGLSNDLVLREYLQYLLRVICTGYERVSQLNKTKDYPEIDLANFGIDVDDIDALFNLAKDKRDYTQLYILTYDFLTLKNGKNRWLDKLPGYVAQIDQILEQLPTSKAIELVRDPRDILASKQKRKERGGAYDPLWDSLAWKSAIYSADQSRCVYPGRIMRVRYEDLVSDTQTAVQNICDFLDIEYNEDMLEVGWINTAAIPPRAVGQEIGTSAIGKWERELSSSDALVCQLITKQELLQNSYNIPPISAIHYLGFPMIIIRSFAEFISRLYDRWQSGGSYYLLNVLSNYLLRLSKIMK